MDEHGTTTIRQSCVLSDGIKISLSFRSHPKPILPGLVILLHGRLHSSKKGPCYELSKRLSYSTLTYDARGMGESEGRTGWANVEEETDDLEQIIDYLKANFKPPHDRVIGIVGHSKGAAVCLRYGARPTSRAQISQPALYDDQFRPPLLISISARYDGSQTGLTRFTSQQCEQLEKDGQFVWLKYRAGVNNEERRDYVITKEATEAAKGLTMEFVKDLPEASQVLLLHGRADGTVLYQETEKVDRQIRQHNQRTSVDVMLVEGVQHNWDQAGEIEMMADWISSWIKKRAGRNPARVPDHELRDHLRLETLDRQT